MPARRHALPDGRIAGGHGDPSRRDQHARRHRRPSSRRPAAAAGHLGGADRPGRPGPHDAAVWVLEDLTRLHQTLEVLRASEEKYRGLVETLPDAQFSSTARADPLHEPGEGPGRRRAKALASRRLASPPLPRGPAAGHEVLREALAGQTVRVEVRYRAKDGSEKVGYVLLQPRRQGGEVAGSPWWWT